MKFYHGTSIENWNKIQEEGVLWGNVDKDYRYTYLTPDVEIAKNFGNVILEIEYKPCGIDGRGIDNYGFNPPKGMVCWQFSVFIPIELNKIKIWQNIK